MSDKEIKEVMESPNREPDRRRDLPAHARALPPDRAGSTTATTHWSITGRPDGGADEWTVRFADGTCTSVARPRRRRDAVARRCRPVDFTKVVTKSGNPVMMFMTGKIKAKGDLGLAANIANFFDIPKA